ncbi:MAG: signal recognition particle protein [Eubacteriaceae bacterium]|nr:signal recognition particle protein [Eubacteriaceae bacterium]
MFDSLSEKIQQAFKKLTGRGKLSEKDIDAALREIRMSLLEADVNYKVAKNFLTDVRERAMDSDIFHSLTPGQTMIKIVYEALSDLLGGTAAQINTGSTSPFVIMVAGVQGSGKTTSAAKLALHFKNKGKRVMVAACDTKRAAAVSQLEVLLKSIDVPMYSAQGLEPAEVASNACKEAKLQAREILIIDTAGRQHVDEALMQEIAAIYEAAKPHETLFVVDSMMGQQAVSSAEAFGQAIDISGFILTKADSDARGGAALSVAYITGKPIKFAATGEKLSDFEIFHPDRIASRILGMGDMATLIEKAQASFDEEAALAMAEKLEKNTFNLQDYLEQLDQISEMGSLEEIIKSIPGANKMGPIEADEREIARTKAIIQSMTMKERENPQILNASRKRRIAAGSGTKVSDVNQLIKGYDQMRKIIKQLSGKKGKRMNRLNLPFQL